MNPRPVIAALCCTIVIVATVYFGGQYILKQGRIETSTPPATSPGKALTPDKASSPQAGQHEEDQPLNNPPAEITAPSDSSSAPAVSENEQNTDSAPISEKTEGSDVPVSPYGFGPYPELHPSCPEDFWDGMSKEHELIARVRLKLKAEGGSMQNGLVYLNFRDRIYVEWDWNGKKRYISRIMGHPETTRSLRTFPPSPLTEEDIPANIKVFTLPDGGIDPYKFLNLKE